MGKMRETTMLLFGVLAGEDDGRNDETSMSCSGLGVDD